MGRTARLAAVALLAGVLGAAALMLAQADRPAPPVRPPVSAEPAAADPLRAELARCRGLAAEDEDAACEEAWEEHRRRFFARGRGEGR